MKNTTNTRGKTMEDFIKIAKTLKGHPHEIKKIRGSDLIVNQRAQRMLKRSKCEDIIKSYLPDLVNPVKASYRDNLYYVFDGQHTAEVQKMIFGEDCLIECMVYYGLTEEEEAELFLLQFGKATPIPVGDKVRVKVNFGDIDMSDMVLCCNMAGWNVSYNNNVQNNYISSVGQLRKCYEQLDRDVFIDMLNVLKKAWGGSPESVSRDMLIGMTSFFKAYYGQFETQRLAQSLNKVHPLVLLREGRANLAVQRKRNIAFATPILKQYNKGRKKQLNATVISEQ